MSLVDKLTALIPFGRKKEVLEYFFALNISLEKLTVALWTIEGKQLKVLEKTAENYSSLEDLTPTTDKLLDAALGARSLEPQKILFGVPSLWLSDENLKEEKIKILRKLVKDLELTPMAYVENSHALIHFLEKTEGVPPTAILVEFETHHLTVTVVRAGKLDGVKVIQRGENSGTDIEKALLAFAAVETLPSKILIYGRGVTPLKNQLLSHPWMSKLSFLHFPKIDTLPDDIEITSICFAGASEIDSDVSYSQKTIAGSVLRQDDLTKDEGDLKKVDSDKVVVSGLDKETEEDLGFMVGDVSTKEESNQIEEVIDEENIVSVNTDFNGDNIDQDLPAPQKSELASVKTALTGIASMLEKVKRFNFKKFQPSKFKNYPVLIGVVVVLLLLVISYLILPKAEVKIFVEPKIVEKDTTVIADPNQKEVNEEGKVIPGQVVETEVQGSGKETATGEKEIGNPAKGTIKLINNSNQERTLSKGAIISAGSTKFALDLLVKIASTSATSVSKSTETATVTAAAVGADGNLPSGTSFISAVSDVAIVAEGNFSGGTSKKVTVVSSDDQNKLLASLASNLRHQAQAKLQEKLPEKKILEEALLETITKKSFNKNINDQGSDFSLDLTAKFKGTAFEDKDLKSIVSKLVVTQVPEGFKLNLEDTETQADVSKVEKDGKLVFLAKFKAKLMPTIDPESVKNKIKGRDLNDALNVIKSMENILGAEIKLSPAIPLLQRIPILSQNIIVEVGLK